MEGFRRAENRPYFFTFHYYFFLRISHSAKNSMLIYPPCSEIRLLFSVKPPLIHGRQINFRSPFSPLGFIFFRAVLLNVCLPPIGEKLLTRLI